MIKEIGCSIILLSTLLVSKVPAQEESLINTSHLDHLYSNIVVNDDTMGIVHIYSDYPNYNYVEAKGEGIACVDDAARAEIFYIKYYHQHPDIKVLKKIENLTKFLLYMQSSNGFFYNFIWNDYTIDSTYRTSVAQPNWWTWRAIWALSEAAKFFHNEDINPSGARHSTGFLQEIMNRLSKTVSITHNWLNNNFTDSTKNYGGFSVPGWLPFRNAADQAAIIVKALCVYYEVTKSKEVKNDIIKLCDGIEKMQVHSKKNPPYSSFLSWENSWHGWGNSQADALIDAGRLFGKKQYIRHAADEIKYFYPYLMKNSYFTDFKVEKKGETIKILDEHKFSQIAYQIRPMVWACLNFVRIKKNKEVEIMAGKIATWLLGNNAAKQVMYNQQDGVCFDGILSDTEVNKNSGAESTVEALLTLIEIENNPTAEKTLFDWIKNKSN